MQLEITSVCDKIKAMLITKNKAYGNSAIDPVRIFSKANPVEQILVRLDDKLSRIARGHEFPGEDVIDDTIGYLILLKIARAKERYMLNETEHDDDDGEILSLGEIIAASSLKAKTAIINPVVQ